MNCFACGRVDKLKKDTDVLGSDRNVYCTRCNVYTRPIDRLAMLREIIALMKS